MVIVGFLQNLDLKHMASECAVIKDELDVLRHISDKAVSDMSIF